MSHNGPALQLRGAVGDRLGPFKLRGLADRVEVVQVGAGRCAPWGP